MKTIYYKYNDNYLKFKSSYFNDDKDYNKNKIIQSLKISLTKKHKISIQEYCIKEYNFNIEKCGFCDNHSKIDIIFDFVPYKKSYLIIIKGVLYPNNYYYCKENNCPGKKLNPNSIKFVSKSRKINEEKALKLIHNRNKSPFYEENHSNIDEYKNYQSLNKRLNNEEYEEYIKNLKYSKTIEYYFDKYGKNEGEIIWNDIQSKKDSMSLDFFLKKYNHNYKKAIKEYKNRVKSVIPTINCKGSNYSIESINFFDKIINILELNKNNCLYGENEYMIKYKNKKSKFGYRKFYYDFTDIDNKIIIEYNGIRWHPNSQKMTNEDFKNWKHPFNKDIIPHDIEKKDKLKKETAIKNGFIVLVVWDIDGTEKNIKKIKDYYDRKLFRIN